MKKCWFNTKRGGKENKIHETYRKQVAKWQMSIQQYQYYIKYECTKDFNQTYK